LFDCQDIVSIGGANIDIKAKSLKAVLPGTSNPVRSYYSQGGVARNIAENLARLKAPVRLISRVGRDSAGDSLLANLTSLELDTASISRSVISPTATYTALLDPQGEMWVALADMEIYAELTVEVLRDDLALIRAAAFLVVDTNLPAESLEFLSRENKNTWAVPVSEFKVDRLRFAVPYLRGIILNERELAALQSPEAQERSCELSEDAALRKNADFLLSRGLSAVVVTRGAKGVYVATPESCHFFAVPKKEVHADVTGAGDSLAAGIIFGLHQGRTLVESVPLGIAASALSLRASESVSPLLTLEKLLEEMALAPSKITPGYVDAKCAVSSE
jgi:pseudouridine kinase